MNSTAVEEQKSQEFVDLSISEIHDDPDNLRQEYDGIEELAESIVQEGLLQPIVCRRDEDGKYIIKAGHRRKRALILAGENRTRVILDHRATLKENVIATMLIENSQRKDLNPMEQAFGLKRIQSEMEQRLEKKITAQEIGHRIGRTQVWVSDRLALLHLNPDHQRMVREGRMTLQEAKNIGRTNSGNIRPKAKGKKSGGYFTTHHDLGTKAARRCEALGHKSGGPNYVAIACGNCWEHVIRADERAKLQSAAQRDGDCATCGQPVAKESADATSGS